MSQIHVQLLGDGACRIDHLSAEATLWTDKSPQYGGQGRSFSSTDLVAAALGSCIATSLEQVAQRGGLDVARLAIQVEKTLATEPVRRIAALHVTIFVGGSADETLRRKLERAAHSCPVHRSLHPDVESSIRFRFAGESGEAMPGMG